MTHDLLPVGSVLILKGSSSKIMVAGYGPMNKEKNWYFEYLGISYPGGVGANNDAVMFDSHMIETVIHFGYSDKKASAVYSAIGKMIQKNETSN